MGMYSSIGGTASVSDVNGLPNVGQYGWTAYEIEEFKQLSHYVDEAKRYHDTIIQTGIHMEVLYSAILSIKSDVDSLAALMAQNVKTVQEQHDAVKGWYDQIGLWKSDFERMVAQGEQTLATIEQFFDSITAMRDEVRALKDNVDVSRDAAAASAASANASESGAKSWYDKSYDIYLDLQKGQVYRGTWNPNSGAYPDAGGTNSAWDVILNEGQEEFTFDNKRWWFGDRLVYSLFDKTYYQIESGTATGVKSVNGKNGAVILNAEDVKALPISGGRLTGDVETLGDIVLDTERSIRLKSFRGINLHALNLSAANEMTVGNMFTSVVINSDKNPRLRVASVYHDFYTSLNKPKPSDLGMYSNAEIDTILGDFSNATYTKAQVDNKLDLKADKTTTDNLTSSKADKSTTINGHTLSDDVVLSATDVNALPNTGGTVTGNISIEEGGLSCRKTNYPGIVLYNNTAPKDTDSFHMETEGSGVLNFVYRDSTTGTNKAVVKLSNSASGFIYHTGNNPVPKDMGAADALVGSSDITLLADVNRTRDKEVKIYSKDNNLYTVSQDGSVAKFYNDRTYRPTASDFGGLFVESGNTVNFPIEAGNDTLYFNYAPRGGQSVSNIRFHNGKSQAAGLADVFASTFQATNGHIIYNGTSSNDSSLFTYIDNVPTIRYGGTGAGANNGFQILGPGNNLKMKVTDNGEVIAPYANNYRISRGDYGTFWRNDGASLYLMRTAKGDPNGSFDTLRPLRLDLVSGDVSIHQTRFAGDGTNRTFFGGDTIMNQVSGSGSYFLTRNWGTTGRKNVLQVEDSEGWHHYTQRSTSGSVVFTINGDLGVNAGIKTYGRVSDAPQGTNGFATAILFNGSYGVQNANGRCGIGYHDNGNIYAWNCKDGNTATYSMSMSRDAVNFSGIVQAPYYRRADGSTLIAPDGNINLLNPPSGLGYVNGYFLQQVLTRGNFFNHGQMIELNSGYTCSGAGAALIRGRVQAGSWSSWRDRAAGVNVDNQSTDGVANIWKLTNWGKHHIASMAGYAPGGNLDNAIMKLTVHNNGFDFTANGNFTIAGTGYGKAWTVSSDIKLKEDITPITSALSYVDKIDTVNYKLKSDQSQNIGYIAQNLEELIPEVVSTTEEQEGKDSHLTVNYGAMSAYNTACIKEMKVLIEEQRSEIDELKQMVKELLSK